MEPALNRILNALKDQQIYNLAGVGAMRLLLKRVREGKSLTGGKFKGGKGYSEGHKKKRKVAGLPTDVINLEFNDYEGMLKGIQYDIDPAAFAVNLEIPNARDNQIAYYLSESGAGINKVKFPFWGLNSDEQKQITALVEDTLMKVIFRDLAI